MAPLEELEHAYLEARQDPAFQAELSDLLRNYAGPAHAALFRRAAFTERWAARASSSSAKTCCTPARTRSTTAWARRCWRGAWASAASSPKPAPASTAWPPPRSARCWASNAWSTWARRTCAASASTSSACGCWARRWCRVTSGSRTLKDAISEAMRDWVTNVGDTYYLLGSALGAHPYPMMVRDFQKVIGEEARRQILEAEGRLPDAIFACVGGGCNAIGIFHAFLADRTVAADRRRSRRPRRRAGRTCGALPRRRAGRAARRVQLPVAGRRRPECRSRIRFRRAWITP